MCICNTRFIENKMANRVVLGKKGSDYGLFISKPTLDATSEGNDDMLLSSTAPSMGQTLLFQKFDVSANSTVTQAYNNQGGVKTFCMFWANNDYLGGASDDYYTIDNGFSGSAVGLTFENAYTNSTTNTLSIVNITNVARSAIVLVLKEAAA